MTGLWRQDRYTSLSNKFLYLSFMIFYDREVNKMQIYIFKRNCVIGGLSSNRITGAVTPVHVQFNVLCSWTLLDN